MPIFSFRKNAGPDQVKENPAGLVDAGYIKNRPAPYEKRVIFKQLSRHPLAVMCVKKIASEAAQAVFTAPDDSRINEILNRPSPEYSGFRFRKSIYMSLAGVGDSYIVSDTDARNRIDELWPVRADRISSNVDTLRTGRVTSYDYQHAGRKRVFMAEDVLHVRHDWIDMGEHGLSVAETITDLLKYWDGYNCYNNRLLDGTQAVAAMYGLKSNSDNLTADQMSKVTQIMNMFKLSLSNGNMGARAFINAPIEKIDDGHSPGDLHVTEWFDKLTSLILNAYQVPPILLDVGSNATYENLNTALQSFWFNTLIPNYVQPVAEELGAWLGTRIEIDYSKVRAIADAECNRALKIDSIRHISVNEKRAMGGREAVEGGDVIYQDASSLPIDFDVDTPSAIERSVDALANDRGIRLVK